MSTVPESPCIRQCCLDDDLTCLGCFRSLQEIKDWSIVSHPLRHAILQNAQTRREAYQRRYPARGKFGL
jgi:uncharacterized protein